MVAAVLGVLVGAVAAVAGAGRSAPLVGWDVLALTFCLWTWRSIRPLDSAATSAHVQRDNPGRRATDVVLVLAGLASLVAVGAVLFGAANEPGATKYFQAGLALVSVFISWTTVHTVFTTRYAQFYYEGPPGSVDFNEDDAPDYRDFAYLAFTIGMTFQVSDTDLETSGLRRIALRHMLISYLFGAVIIAVTINLVAGMTK